MREIKFRQRAGGRFYYWGFGVSDDGSYFTGPVSGGSITPHKCPNDQYTGLKDKKGTEVWEHDILGGNLIVPRVVIYEYGSFRLKDGSNSSNQILHPETVKRLQVIGNIYDNPDLLEE